jgi:long-chain acyl-CoA synthetase
VNVAALIAPHPPDTVALISRGKSFTYGELRDHVARLAGGLVGVGVCPGDRVGVACGNNANYVVSFLAALHAGAIAVPLNPTAPGPELTHQLARAGVKVLIVGPSATAVVAELDRDELAELDTVVALRPTDIDDAVAYDVLAAAEPIALVEREANDPAVLMFTSGTVGVPRAATLTHANLLANLDQIQAHPGRSQRADDVVLGVLPLFHIFGLNVVLGLTFLSGSRVVLVERFDPTSALEAIVRHGITVVIGAPTMYAAWASLPDADLRAFASVRIATSGAAKLAVEVAQRFEDRFDVHIAEGYGLTEAGPVLTVSSGTDAPFGSIGPPLPGVELRLVDGDGDDVLLGDSGELWARGPNVFAGYWNDPEATAAALTADGWLRTGDVAVMDDDGYVYLVDRAKDLIIVSGFNVFPAEVEEVLARHPAVAGCAVVGVAHPYTGEAVKAFVVLAPDRSADEDELAAWCAQHLARYKCPSKVMFVDELPTGSSGKVLRRALH